MMSARSARSTGGGKQPKRAKSHKKARKKTTKKARPKRAKKKTAKKGPRTISRDRVRDQAVGLFGGPSKAEVDESPKVLDLTELTSEKLVVEAPPAPPPAPLTPPPVPEAWKDLVPRPGTPPKPQGTPTGGAKPAEKPGAARPQAPAGEHPEHAQLASALAAAAHEHDAAREDGAAAPPGSTVTSRPSTPARPEEQTVTKKKSKAKKTARPTTKHAAPKPAPATAAPKPAAKTEPEPVAKAPPTPAAPPPVPVSRPVAVSRPAAQSPDTPVAAGELRSMLGRIQQGIEKLTRQERFGKFSIITLAGAFVQVLVLVLLVVLLVMAFIATKTAQDVTLIGAAGIILQLIAMTCFLFGRQK
jgi:hypothetical protein